MKQEVTNYKKSKINNRQSVKRRVITFLLRLCFTDRGLMCLVSAVLGMVVCSEALCSWTGSNADRPTDQSSFTETHLLVINGQVSHTAHIGLPGGNALWQEKI